jgi:hypothetical protein
MSIFDAWKAAKIAHAVERNIMPIMSEVMLLNYKGMYAWGTEGGNYLYDQVARRSRKERLSEADDYCLSLLYLILQARADDNSGAERCFERILNNVLPHMIDKLSIKVLAELMAHVGPKD